MATILRVRLTNLCTGGYLTELCKIQLKHPNVLNIQKATITSKAARKHYPPRIPPVDWRNKKVGLWVTLTDPMFRRWDDNTKIICVEGMPGVGKTKFGKQLAEELDMQYVPAPNFDNHFITDYGYDYRSLSEKLPYDLHLPDDTLFHKDPHHKNIAAMQLNYFTERVDAYLDALADVMSSGIGAVTHRSPFSDVVFVDAMFEAGYLTGPQRRVCYRAASLVLPVLLKPHLTIYLDAPISVVKENIKKRNDPFESKSKALTDQYLEELERVYKRFLKTTTVYGHLLTYDWSTEGDCTAVVEDIERLNFDYNINIREKFYDWDFIRGEDLRQKREDYCNMKYDILLDIGHRCGDLPELRYNYEESAIIKKELMKVPLEKYFPNFDEYSHKGRVLRRNLWDI